MENFNECYHCPSVHKVLSKDVLTLNQYSTRMTEYGTRHESASKCKSSTFYTWWFFPNFAIQMYPSGIVNTYQWKAISVAETQIEVVWWLPNSIPSDDEKKVIEQHRNFTFAEDASVVDSVQRGLQTEVLDYPRYVVDENNTYNSEHPILAFHKHYCKIFEEC
ncbi:hypothetical protein L1D55_27065 [Vibrio sp. Isolate22]|nr:hypothetical protein [Vibrio sp. Isolate22]